MDEAEEEWIRLIFDEARDTRNSTYENFSKLFSPACDSIAYNEQYYSGFVVSPVSRNQVLLSAFSDLPRRLRGLNLNQYLECSTVMRNLNIMASF